MFRKKLQRFMTGTLVAGLLCSQIIGASAQSTTNEEPTSDNNVYLSATSDGNQPEDPHLKNAPIIADSSQFPVVEESQGISAASVDAFNVLTWTVQNRLGIGTMNPQAQIHVTNGQNNNWGMILSSPGGSAYGLKINSGWYGNNIPIFQANALSGTLEIPRLVVKANGNISAIGNVGIGTMTPNAKLDVYGTYNDQWGMKISSLGGSARGLLINTAYPGHSNVPLLQANAGDGSPRFVVQANGQVGVGTLTPTAKLDIVASNEGNLALRLRSGPNAFLDIKPTNTNSRFQTVFDTVNNRDIVFLPGTTGNVGIGTTSPQAKLDVAGTTRTKVLQITGGADLAEPFAVNSAQSVEPGMVVAIDPENPGQLRLSGQAYDHMVAGVVSGAGGIQPGLILQQEGTTADGDHPVALTGRVYVWADASNGPIQPGDLLTTSSTLGHAMKATDPAQSQGAVLGKAMGTLEEGTGLVLMLVTLQ